MMAWTVVSLGDTRGRVILPLRAAVAFSLSAWRSISWKNISIKQSRWDCRDQVSNELSLNPFWPPQRAADQRSLA